MKNPFEMFGYEVGSGWKPIAEEAVAKLKALGAEIFQVKEKFGGLRIYLNGYTYEMDKIIEEAAKVCSKTCEVCGEPGEMDRDRYWIQVLCEKCKEGKKK